MPARLFLAPAAAGKTAHAIALARARAGRLDAEVRVVVASPLQVTSWQRRLAEAGGALGIHVMTFERLAVVCLDAAGTAYSEVSDPVQVRLIRALLDTLPLTYFRPLVRRPGFTVALQAAFAELKRSRIAPAALLTATEDLGNEPRLVELAHIYGAYQSALLDRGWTDRAGILWLAADALKAHEDLARDWPSLILDGFNQFDRAQLHLLALLNARAGETVIMLTDGSPGYPRLLETQRRLEAALGIQAESLERSNGSTGAREHGSTRVRGYGDTETRPVAYVEAPDRAGEVRAALRWLKARIKSDELEPGETALLARNMAPYLPFIPQIAAEFGLPIRLVDGLRLRDNPAVAALLDLLSLMLPAPGGPTLPRRPVVAAWRSPYFNWDALPALEAPEPIGIGPGDADRLDAASRYGLVLGGLAQWREALARLAATQPDEAAGILRDTEDMPPANVPAGPDAQLLLARFDRFVQRLTPPVDAGTLRAFVAWVEGLIGPDLVAQQPGPFPAPAERDPTALDIVGQARAGDPDAAVRDLAALRALKDVLRGLVWAEEALGTPQGLTYAGFLDELVGAVESASFKLPLRRDGLAILIADIAAARGLPFRAVALLGLAEGEFPAPQREDPFLRDSDRAKLTEFGLPLDPTTESAEREYFYEATHRARDQMLLTRPRLEETGADWLPSPFWEEMQRRAPADPLQLTTDTLPDPAEAASWEELLESLAAGNGGTALVRWVAENRPAALAELHAAATVHAARLSRAVSPFDGDLGEMADELDLLYGPGHIWSPSRLEQVHACAHFFFVSRVLGLEPRPEPAAGMEAVQLGSLYHAILEALHTRGNAFDAGDEELAGLVERIAAPLLDAAPLREGFRETAWWQQTRAEILADLVRTVAALNAEAGSYRPVATEVPFGLRGFPPLTLQADGQSFQLRGFIDRVDRDPDGNIRVIDYKTAGPSGYTAKDLESGKRLQLPLYALAAREALGLGAVADGFYWHIQQARSSNLSLARYGDGPEDALAVAVELAWDAVRRVRAGAFAPRPPAGGCPSYCPATAYCRHYRGGFA